jgi:hypothetical protein
MITMDSKPERECEVCVICLDQIDSENDKTVTLDGCAHIVHSSCFFTYINKHLESYNSVSCPICRHVLIKIDREPQHQVFVIEDPDASSSPKCNLFVRVCVATIGVFTFGWILDQMLNTMT